MPKSVVNIRNFILGLLAQQPMSGYDIKRLSESLSWLIGGLSYGSLYPALHALLQEGLVEVDVVQNEDRPPRKVYSLTNKGKQVIKSWGSQPIKKEASLKDFVMCLFMGSNLPLSSLEEHIRQRKLQVRQHRDTLVQMMERESNIVDLGHRMAMGYGLAIANAELAWLESMLAELSKDPLPMEVKEGS
ncbi:MAG: PadR family transcriptional regulator [Anaerolineae bacterium]|nr:PadR family transcriptional regulator [Anaerolineae bacterium]